MEITGNWTQGYVLDYHTIKSEFICCDEDGYKRFYTEYSEIGGLLNRLKYDYDRSAIEPIIEITVCFIKEIWKPEIDIIIPVPPSRKRRFQPVIKLAKKLGIQLQIDCKGKYLKKVKCTQELKDIYDFDERMRILEDAFYVKKVISNKNVLLFDDLYRSGATLNAVSHILHSKGDAKDIYVLALTKTRSKR